MIYAGGTDPGAFNKRIYEEYASDARKRFEHDQQFPDEPKQLRPDEDISIVDGKVKVAGYVAVMALNEKLFQLLMQKNPETSFAMEESYPFKSTFGTATALGALMELRVQDEQNVLTRERAAQSVDYWRTTAQQLLADTEAADSRYVRMAYSKLASSQAGLLLERGYTAEAEQAFRYAYHIAPTSPEAVYRYINLLVGQNRVHDALPLAENAVRMEPENKQFRNLVQELQKKNRH
jgi:tetratricopeptide (TPR) repeat protein